MAEDQRQSLPFVEDAYKIKIDVRSTRFLLKEQNYETRIEGRLPQDFEVTLVSEYSEQYQHSGKGLVDFITVATTGNVIALPEVFSTARWQGTQGIEFDMEIEFIAERDERRDVLYPVFVLQQLVVPSEGQLDEDTISFIRSVLSEEDLERIDAGTQALQEAGLPIEGGLASSFALRPPGPIPLGLASATSGADVVTFRIGNFMVVPNAIIQEARTTFSGIMTRNRMPQSAKVALRIKCARPTQASLLGAMYVPALGSANALNAFAPLTDGREQGGSGPGTSGE